jgi:hypothetical protein
LIALEGVLLYFPKSFDIFNLYFELAKLKLSEVLFRFVVDVIPLVNCVIVYLLLASVYARIV